jgi:hypothetical protein
LGQIAPLEVRWREAMERVETELPADHPLQSACHGMMRSELALDDVLDALEAALAAMMPPEPTPESRAAVAEIRDMQRQFNSCSLEIKAAQPWLLRARDDWKHRLLKDIAADCFNVPGLYPMGVGGGPQFTSIYQARQAAKEMLPRLQWARGVCAAIKAARSFDNQSPDAQAMELCHTIVKRLAERDERIIGLEAQCTALEARLNRLERGRRKKSTIKAAA